MYRISRQSAHEGDKLVSPVQRPPLPPENIPVIYFCWRLSRPLGKYAAERDKLMKNSNDLIGNRPRDIPSGSAGLYQLHHRIPLS